MDLEQLKKSPAALQAYRERVPLTDYGKYLQGNCPFHDDSKPSFNVYKGKKDGAWLYYCQGCHVKNGTVFKFLQQFEDVSFNAAVELVQEIDRDKGSWEENRAKVEGTFKRITDKEEKKTFPLSAITVFEKSLAESGEAQKWLLEKRGITLETAQRMHFGYRKDLSHYKRIPEIANKGWIMMPVISEGRVVSIKYRSMVEKEFVRESGMDSTVLFNTETIDPFEPVYVTEGEFDAGVLEQAGFHAVSLQNAKTRLTPEMKDLLKTAAFIVLAGDHDGKDEKGNDKAGDEAMARLWRELGKNTVKLQWPEGMKDANQTFLEHCKRDVEAFRSLVGQLTDEAQKNPMPHIYSLSESMRFSQNSNLADSPLRLRFPWKSIDSMVILLPGSVFYVSATNTGMGKTAFVMNLTVEAARQHGEVVLNYQCELSDQEFSTMVTSYVLKKDRNHLNKHDGEIAARKLGSVEYYIGHDPNLTRVNEVLDLIEAAVQRLGATVVVIDHIHFICRNEENEIQAQANAMQRIKNMARKYGLKFVVVGQPRKATQQNKGKVIHITDQKGSEALTSDSDAVGILHRDYVKHKDPNNPPKDEYDAITEYHQQKARAKGDGNAFTRLNFVGSVATFYELTPEEPPPGRNVSKVVNG